ncbi:class II aldolase/adducin family protein [Zooshikella ganghwensis]|uniref:Class II aldolase/adducin family protein n=1 Tax=Zooshikella ganghwensis TaxID=202772 RepID=A0A4P9VT63_9GAMM|nr:class II aldolase/adducin family protein [Zooshikella ganghwensis]RDH45230.1 class II aldolase/adducin family protein [Zooshikella ganghwensis]
MTIKETEGVIKYQLHHRQEPITIPDQLTQALTAWRSILVKLEVIGQDAHRYQGFGFGNLSARSNNNTFYITGTQTGEYPVLQQKHYSEVIEANINEFSIYSRGLTKPSSEALSHSAVYQASPDINFVFHGHSPEIWHATQQLNLPAIPANIAYGTQAMAEAVTKLLHEKPATSGFVMEGHEDGIITFGRTAEQAGLTFVAWLANALQCAS